MAQDRNNILSLMPTCNESRNGQISMRRRSLACRCARTPSLRLFSMTKPVMAVAMMILREEGRSPPECRLAAHLPERAGLQPLHGVDANGVPILLSSPMPGRIMGSIVIPMMA